MRGKEPIHLLIAGEVAAIRRIQTLAQHPDVVLIGIQITRQGVVDDMRDVLKVKIGYTICGGMKTLRYSVQ